MLITHIYPVFCKLMEEKDANERLAQTLCEMYQEKIAVSASKNFYEMNQFETKKVFRKHQEKVQNALNREIKNIFHSQVHFIQKQEGNVKFLKIISGNYTYTFVTDKNVAILTDFYPTLQEPSLNLLQTSGHKYTVNHKICYLTNTYNAFCNYAKYIQRTDKPELTGRLNASLFHSAKNELEQRVNSAQHRVIKISNFIILYEFELRVYVATPVAMPISIAATVV